MKRTLALLATLSLALVMNVGGVRANPPGLVPLDSGAAAYYAPAWDYGGWDRIRTAQARNHGLDPAQVYDPDGWYCVRPGVAIGATLTLRNDDTGATGTCMVADAVAPQDQAVWWSRWVVEVSYAAFAGLGLDGGNHVSVWVAP